ncbi:MAG TPA: type II toxin-antitoxin system PemK/MazF family toxin [Anaerolineae bacterium]
MGRFVRGDGVVLPFPFSDLSESKRRPALVLAHAGGDDVILSMITSQARADGFAVPVSTGDFATGALQHDSFVRPNRLFSADSRIILYRAGALSRGKLDEVIARVVALFQQ